MRSELQKLIYLLSGVSNPLPAGLDRLGWRRKPYVLRVRESGDLVELRPQSGDLFGFYEIMLRKDYFSAGQTLRPGDTVIDIGANIGCFSVLAAKIVGPTGHVYAVEPEESTYRQLIRNIELNRLANVTPLKLAVGDTEGSITLHADTNRLFSSIFASVNGHVVKGEDQEVQVTTLEKLMNAHGIERCDYLKLDCEGAEHRIVASLSEPAAGRIDQITMELHKVPGFTGEALTRRLDDLGYARVGDSTLPFYRRAPTRQTAQAPLSATA